MRFAIASDHAGFELKATLISYLRERGDEVTDLGTDSTAPVDYPPFCARAARAVTHEEADVGIVIGGSGQGEAIAANKVHGVRAALCYNEEVARLARAHNNANVLSLGARLTAPAEAIEILKVFTTTAFEEGRHIPRLEEIAAIERSECGD